MTDISGRSWKRKLPQKCTNVGRQRVQISELLLLLFCLFVCFVFQSRIAGFTWSRRVSCCCYYVVTTSWMSSYSDIILSWPWNLNQSRDVKIQELTNPERPSYTKLTWHVRDLTNSPQGRLVSHKADWSWCNTGWLDQVQLWNYNAADGYLAVFFVIDAATDCVGTDV